MERTLAWASSRGQVLSRHVGCLPVGPAPRHGTRDDTKFHHTSSVAVAAGRYSIVHVHVTNARSRAKASHQCGMVCAAQFACACVCVCVCVCMWRVYVACACGVCACVRVACVCVRVCVCVCGGFAKCVLVRWRSMCVVRQGVALSRASTTQAGLARCRVRGRWGGR